MKVVSILSSALFSVLCLLLGPSLLSAAQGVKGAAKKAPEQKALRKLETQVAMGRVLYLPSSPVILKERVDCAATVAAIRLSGVRTFCFQMGTKSDRRSELEKILTLTGALKIQLWVSVLPPTLGANCLPHKGDFPRWAKEIAALGKKHENLVALYIPDLDQGRNSRILPKSELLSMRAELNAVGMHLIGGAYDILPQSLTQLGGSLDAVVLNYTNRKDQRNLAGLLAGAKAMLPKSCKILGGFNCAPGLTEKTAPTALFLFFGIRYAHRAVDGFVLHELDMRPKAELLPTPGGLSKHFLMLRGFMADLKAGRMFRLPRY